MIDREFVNVWDLDITRPNRRGPGGDSTGDIPIVSNLEASVQFGRRDTQNVDDRSTVITGSIFIDGTDPTTGDVLRLREGDHVQYTMPGGSRSRKQKVILIEPGWCGAELDHVELSI